MGTPQNWLSLLGLWEWLPERAKQPKPRQVHLDPWSAWGYFVSFFVHRYLKKQIAGTFAIAVRGVGSGTGKAISNMSRFDIVGEKMASWSVSPTSWHRASTSCLSVPRSDVTFGY